MSEANIRQQIYTIMSGIADIGKVYDYERWAVDWGKFIELFKSPVHDQIRGWEILRKGVSESKDTLGIGAESNLRSHTFIIRGYMSIKDPEETEKLFNTLIEAIAEVFRSNPTLDGLAEDHEYIQNGLIEARTFSNVLCHYAELTLIVRERI